MENLQHKYILGTGIFKTVGERGGGRVGGNWNLEKLSMQLLFEFPSSGQQISYQITMAVNKKVHIVKYIKCRVLFGKFNVYR